MDKKNQTKNKFKTCLRLFFSSAVILVFIFLLTYFMVFHFVINQQKITFSTNNIPIANPLMGWAPWATIQKSAQPHSLVYADLTWREFEPQEGLFDFNSFEEDKQLNRWKEEGKRVVFRFVLDRPSDEEHLDIPDWLYEKIDRDGDLYDIEYGKGFSPNYANPILIDYHEKVIQDLGNKYGRDDSIAYIELGSLGHWGEWHVKYDEGIRRLPPETTRDEYVSHYLKAFPNTHLLMRRPFNIAIRSHLGLYNDMIGHISSTEEWLDWIKNGGDYQQAQEENALSAMPEGWQVAPIGGEQTTSIGNEDLYGKYLEQTIDLLKASHTTFIGPGSPYNIGEGTNLQVGIDQVLATIGYRLYIKQISIPEWIYWRNEIPIEIIFSNDGIAPIYYNWQCNIYIENDQGNILTEDKLDIDLRAILPKQDIRVKYQLPYEITNDKPFSVGIAIIDPITNQAAVKFAMDNSREDLIQNLGQFRVIKIINRIRIFLEKIINQE